MANNKRDLVSNKIKGKGQHGGCPVTSTGHQGIRTTALTHVHGHMHTCHTHTWNQWFGWRCHSVICVQRLREHVCTPGSFIVWSLWSKPQSSLKRSRDNFSLGTRMIKPSCFCWATQGMAWRFRWSHVDSFQASRQLQGVRHDRAKPQGSGSNTSGPTKEGYLLKWFFIVVVFEWEYHIY